MELAAPLVVGGGDNFETGLFFVRPPLNIFLIMVWDPWMPFSPGPTHIEAVLGILISAQLAQIWNFTIWTGLAGQRLKCSGPPQYWLDREKKAFRGPTLLYGRYLEGGEKKIIRSQNYHPPLLVERLTPKLLFLDLGPPFSAWTLLNAPKWWFDEEPLCSTHMCWPNIF